MTITKRQEQILNRIVKDYINLAQPISSEFLEKKYNLGVSPATIRIELQKLTDRGYLYQPHTSAGRAPTDKGYRFFVDKFFAEKEGFYSAFIFKEIKTVKKQIENELRLAEELTESLEKMSSILSFKCWPEKETLFEILTKIGPSKTTYDKNISLINSLIKELKNF